MDKKHIRENADFVLSHYRQLSRLTDGFENEGTLLRSLNIKKADMNENMPEKPYSNINEFKKEKLAIVYAWQQLKLKHREVLFLAYMDREERTTNEIAYLLNIQPKSASSRKTTALLAFASLYKKGVLLDM